MVVAYVVSKCKLVNCVSSAAMVVYSLCSVKMYNSFNSGTCAYIHTGCALLNID